MMEKRIAEIIATCEKYGFMERTVQPYSFVMTVRELVEPWRDYSHYTKESKWLMKKEIEGFEDTLKQWVKVANEPMIRILLIAGGCAGEIREYHKSIADTYLECGLAELA